MDERLRSEIMEAITQSVHSAVNQNFLRLESSMKALGDQVVDLRVSFGQHESEIGHLKEMDGRIRMLEVGPEAPACSRLHEDVRKLSSLVSEAAGSAKGGDRTTGKFFKAAQLLIPFMAVVLTYILSQHKVPDNSTTRPTHGFIPTAAASQTSRLPSGVDAFMATGTTSDVLP